MLFELGFGLAEVVWGVGAAMLENFSERTGEGLAEGLVEKVFGGGEALEQDQNLALALRDNQELLAQFGAVQQDLAQAQAQQNRLKREELELAAQQGAMSLALTQRLAEANLDLGWRKLEQDGLIEREKLDQQRQLAQQEMQLQAWLQGQSLQLHAQQHQETLETQRQMQAIQIQANWDLQGNLGTVWSRQELENLQTDRPLFLCARMQVGENCPSYFREDMAVEAESQMLMFAGEVFGRDVQFYSRFFQDQAVFDAHASRLQGLITQTPVVMALGRMVKRRAFLHYVLWNSGSAALLGGRFDRQLEWQALARQLEQEARKQDRDITEEEILEVVGDWLIALQKLFACYLMDLQAVVDGENPYVPLRLEGLDLGGLEPLVCTHKAPLLAQLRKLQQARVLKFEQLLQEAEAEKLREAQEQQRREAEERERRRQEQQKEQQAEAKRQAALDAERIRQEREERRRQEEERQRKEEEARRQREAAEAQRQAEKQRQREAAEAQRKAEEERQRQREEEQQRKAEEERQRREVARWDIDAVPLKTETGGFLKKGVDYTRLRDLLKAGQWKEADQETYQRMLEATGRTKEGWFRSKDLLNFPCADLKTIDRLWVQASQGRYGFSVQKEIYVKCGGKLDGKYPGDTIWRKFGDEVGWRVNGSWVGYDDLNWGGIGVPGHLPCYYGGLLGLLWLYGYICGSLLSHRDL